MYTYMDYCCFSVAQLGPTLFATPWTMAHQAFLSFTIFQRLLKLMSIELVMPSNHLFLCRPLLLLLSIFPNIKVFSNESALHIRWPKYLEFSCSISPSNEYSELISFSLLVLFPCSPRDSQESSPTKDAPTKENKLAEWMQKQDLYICCIQETHFIPRDTYRLKVKEEKKILHANGNQKKTITRDRKDKT